MNLFIAVLKIKFAKAQTLFHSKLAKMTKQKRKNILGRALEKGKKSVREQMKKKRDASVVGLQIHNTYAWTRISIVHQKHFDIVESPVLSSAAQLWCRVTSCNLPVIDVLAS